MTATATAPTTDVGLAGSAVAFAAFGALGAGVVHLGLASAHATSPAWAAALAVLGLAEAGWAVATLRAGRPVAARPAAAALLVAAAAWPALVAQGVAPHDGGFTATDAAAAVLGVVAAGGVALVGRRRPARRAAWRALAGWAAAALVTAAVTTPALAATPAGDSAVPHGSHGATVPASPADDPAQVVLPGGHAGH